MTIIFAVLAVFCILYYLFIISYAGIHSAFVQFWLISAIILTLIAILSYIGKKYTIFNNIPLKIKIGFLTLLIAGIILFLSVEALIISGMREKPNQDADYVIVLGAQIRGDKITKSLRKRLDTALVYLKANETTKVIVSGGQGDGENLSEAEAMKQYLMEQGIPEERIVKEDRSTSTKENLKFSYELIDEKDSSVVIVTNNFHVFRAKAIAKKIGYKDVQGLAAPSDNRLLLNYMVREFLAIVKEKLYGNI